MPNCENINGTNSIVICFFSSLLSNVYLMRLQKRQERDFSNVRSGNHPKKSEEETDEKYSCFLNRAVLFSDSR